MKVNLPSNCVTEASKLSFAIKLDDVLLKWFNTGRVGKTPHEAKIFFKEEFLPRVKVVHALRNSNINSAQSSNFWNTNINDHWVGNKVVYPVGLNYDNEGSRLSFLYALGPSLTSDKVALQDKHDLTREINQASQDAREGKFWNPRVEDII